MQLICAIVIMSSGGYRDWVEVEGTWLKDVGDYYLIDFTTEFKKRKVNMDYNTYVRKVNNNDCLFKNPSQP